jgi:PAS domain S-box-containing protein
LEHAPVSRAVWIGILVILGLAVIVIIGVILWNRTLVRMVAKQTGELHKELVERRQAEAALRLSKERLKLATQAAGIGIWDWDIVNNRLTWDDSMYDLFGIRPEDFTGDIGAWNRTLHPEDVPRAEAGIQAALRGEREYVSEFRIVRPDGAIRFIKADSQTFFDDQRKPLRMIGTNYDITERKQIEEALRTSEHSSRNLLIAMPIAVALNDERQMITFRNRRFVQLFGYTEDEVPSVAEWMRRAYPDEQVREWVTKTWQGAVQKALDEGTDIEMHEYPTTCKSGEVRIVEIGGIMLGKEMLVTLIDITERKRAEEMLEKRLVELTRPMAGGDVTFEELFNIDDVQRLQDEFSAATGVASLITRPDGTAITTPSNFVRLCSEIIRTSEKGCLNCLKSDAAIGRYHPDGPIVQHCLSGGLWDAGASITVGGHHIANWLVGQVRDETQTEEAMRAYAREIGVDEEAFLEAFYDVPAMVHEQFVRIAQALFTLSGQLSTAAYQIIQQARFITERKLAEEKVRQTLAEKETLIRELYHRTKNNMQIVRSLMNLQAGDAGDETRAIVKEVDNRIQGLALVHEMLYLSSDLSNLDLTAYLDTLVRAIARNFWGHHSPVIVDLSGEPVSVTLDIVTPCGLVINELLSNTFKYAFPDGRHGVITVRIHRDGPNYLMLEYADNGLPEGFDPRDQETLGMQSIFAIVEQQLSGEVRVENAGGLRFVLRIATGHYQERV